MRDGNDVTPIWKSMPSAKDETPTTYADRLGLLYTSQVTSTHKKNLGQFFTPVEIANYMANLLFNQKAKSKISDPGSSIGVIACSLIENLAKTNKSKDILLINLLN
ncbi:MAG: N-6 DNA methylase [Ignavibacteriales bacterium]|nr:N-6 DNA methylase [Ignavibacteriales bacterium]